MKVRIVLADDHNIVREGLRVLIEQHSDLEVVGEAENGRAVLYLVDQLRPDLVIMDVSMPDLNGIDATHEIVRRFPQVKVIGLSMHFDRQFVGKMLMAGASGYLRKACASDEVIKAIRAVSEGKCCVSDGVSSITLKSRDAYLATNHLPDVSSLTQREREIVQLVAEGKLTKEIAIKLNISPKTVETHRQHIMEKLQFRTNAELIKFAIREGLVSLDE